MNKMHPIRFLLVATLALGLASWASAQTPTSPLPGLLVMAHGGDAAWDAAVEEAVAPLRTRYPTAIAFGMAYPALLQRGLDELAAQGVERVAVVRLFIDGRSFLHQTEYLFGLRDDPPPYFILHHHGPAVPHGHGHGAGHGGHHGTPAPLVHDLEIAMSQDGLMQAEELAAVLASRAREVSIDPANESVLLLAHGPGDDVYNARWIVAMERMAGAIRELGFHSVRAETLREDWPEPRAFAERTIRAFVTAETEAGRDVIVVPFRVQGFGPYHRVLAGLTYRPAKAGLLPHEAITAWIEREYHAIVERMGWYTPVP